MSHFSTCILCGEPLDSTQIVVRNGLNKIIQVSKQKQDNIHSELRGAGSVTVHLKCRRNYTDPKRTATEIKRRTEQSKLQRPSPRQDFDFKTKCFICARTVPTPEQRAKHPEREPVSIVGTLVIHESLRNAAVAREDAWGAEVLRRIDGVVDLVAAEGRYHRLCYQQFNKRTTHTSQSPASFLSTSGRQPDGPKQHAFNILCQYLEENEECQYSPAQLWSEMRRLNPLSDVYSEKHMLRLLSQKYGDQIIVSSLAGVDSVVCFKGTVSKLLRRSSLDSADPQQRRLDIVSEASRIIREDIRAMAYDTSRYPTPADFPAGVEQMVPASLRSLLSSVIAYGKKGKAVNYDRRCVALAHAIISHTRPQSFVSPILCGLCMVLHKTFGSKYLIDLLNSLGFSASYLEALNFESAATLSDPISIADDSFVQFVFDNVDINVRTLDGFNTLHCMGGIKCVTPAAAVTVGPIPRSKETGNMRQENFKPFAEIPVRFRPQGTRTGMRSVKVEIPDFDRAHSSLNAALRLDALWLAATWEADEDTMVPSWSGFMTAATAAASGFQTTKIIPLPFVNMQPSNPTTIYTCLRYAATDCEARKQGHCIVTFDLPLYMKAMEIVLSEEPTGPLSRVILRLGGFHLLMSYMGSMGYIMGGSGIENLWETVYAKNTVPHLLSGHAYSRALRAHFLTEQALIHIIMENSEVCPDFPDNVSSTAADLLSNNISSEEAASYPCASHLTDIIENALQTLSKKSRMGRLWVAYIRMVQRIRLYIRAERTGDHDLHLQVVLEMIPNFFAGGRVHYAKAALLYLQHMCPLEKKMSPDDFRNFAEKGYFTIRRSERYWSGTWTDLTIEQNLMRSLKTRGGLSQGRGLGAGSVAKWLNTMPAITPFVESLEEYCGVRAETSEQHKELRESRQHRDKFDLQKFISWLTLHAPFAERENLLVSLSTGVIGDESIDCDLSWERGREEMLRAVGVSYSDLRVRRSAKVKPLSSMIQAIRTRDNEILIPVNQNQLFHRLICTLHKQQRLDILPMCFRFEMAAKPPALFDDGSFMRSGTKSSFVSVLEKFVSPAKEVPRCDGRPQPAYTVDGGFLLHKVQWPSPAQYSQICDVYVAYVKSFRASTHCVIFDGYGSPGTKDEAHLRRGAKLNSSDSEIRDDIVAPFSRERLLGNEKNKEISSNF